MAVQRSKQRSFDTTLQAHRAAQQQQNPRQPKRCRTAPNLPFEQSAFDVGLAAQQGVRRAHGSPGLALRAGMTATILSALCLGAQAAASGLRCDEAPASAPAPSFRLSQRHGAPAPAPAPAWLRASGAPAAPAAAPPAMDPSLGRVSQDAPNNADGCISLSGSACPPSFFNGGSSAYARATNGDGRIETLVVASTSPDLCDDLQQGYVRGGESRMTLRLFDIRNQSRTEPAREGLFQIALPSVTWQLLPFNATGNLAELDFTDFDGACQVAQSSSPIVPWGQSAGTLTLHHLDEGPGEIDVNVTADTDFRFGSPLVGKLNATYCPTLIGQIASEHFELAAFAWVGRNVTPECLG